MNHENLLLKKNVFYFTFKINPLKIKYIQQDQIKILHLKKYFKKKSFPDYKILNSISRFNLNILHFMFIKLLKILDIDFGKNVLIFNSNEINIISLQHFFLLNNQNDLLNNIYIKNNVSINNEIVAVNVFNSKIKYDCIIYDGKKLNFKNNNVNLNIIEDKYINFLFECVLSINESLNKGGTILLLFRFFYIEQVLDYIRLIGHYFKACKIYDFIITELDDIFFICFENYNGIPIKLKSMYFTFPNQIEFEELDKLIILLKKRYYLQKKNLYFHTNLSEEELKSMKLKKKISLVKSIGFTDYDLKIITKKKVTDFLYYLKSFDKLKIFQFDKHFNINNKLFITEQKILTKYKKVMLSFDYIDKEKYFQSKNKTKFYKYTLKNRINKMFETKHISQAWCKSLEIYYFIFSIFKVKKLKSYHLAEYPGNFIRSLQFFCKKKNIVLQDWKAQSLVDSEINDTYNFAENTSQHWDYGYDKTGDLLSKKNQKYYISSIKSFSPNFITADGGFSMEKLDSELIKSEILIIISSLEINGSCLIKAYLPSLELKNEIQCLYESFKKLFFLKSPLNKYSPEYYIFGYKLKKRVLVVKENNQLFHNFYYMYILKLLQNFEKQINIQFFMYENYDTLIRNNIQNITNLIKNKNKIWMENYL